MNLSVLVNTKLHLEEVTELELLRSIGLRIFLRILLLIVILFLGNFFFLLLLIISTARAVCLESAAEHRGSFLNLITLALVCRILLDLSSSQVEAILLSRFWACTSKGRATKGVGSLITIRASSKAWAMITSNRREGLITFL